MSKPEADQEVEFLRICCYQNSFYHYFRLPDEIPDSKKAAFKRHLKEVVELHKCPAFHSMFESISPINIGEAKRIMVSMAGHHLMSPCFSKLISPFTRNPSEQFISAVLADFDILEQRIRPMWPALDNPEITENIQWPIMDKVMHTEDKLAGQRLCTLAFEMHAVHSYNLYRALSPEERKDIQHPRVRRLFWSVAFLFSHLDPKWDRRTEWTDFSLHEYLGPLRAELFETTAQCVQTSADMNAVTAQIRRCYRDLPSGDTTTRPVLLNKLRELSKLDPGAVSPDPRYLEDMRASMHMAKVALEVCMADTDWYLPRAPPAVAAVAASSSSIVPAASRNLIDSIDSIGTDDLFSRLSLDSVVQEDSEPKTSGPKKKTQAQRRKQAKATQAQEIAGCLNDLCSRVATGVAKEYECIVQETILEAVLRDLAAEALNEADTVLNRAKKGTLPNGLAHGLVAAILPDLESTLEPIIECFICMEPLNFDDDGIRFITCCVGGSFACRRCVGKHSGHPMTAEVHIVRQTAAIRRRLKI
jgi:hypothetical protein